MTFENEYPTTYAYFIAGGKTLEVIRQYEQDVANREQLMQALGAELGKGRLSNFSTGATFIADEEISNPALKLISPGDSAKKWLYAVNPKTQEGAAFLERIGEIPQRLGQQVFSKRLTGKSVVPVNPDRLTENYGFDQGFYKQDNTAVGAGFEKYGDTYVVSVPRVLRGVFNEESRKASEEEGYTMAAGYTYEWQAPPDSQQIPWSRVVELQDQQKGDQLVPRTVRKPVLVYSPDP